MVRKLLTLSSVFVLVVSAGMVGVVSTSHATSIEAKSYHGVPYVSGGIGINERQDLTMIGQNYDLKLIFAIQKGNYLADVNVVITDSSGHTVLQTTSQGPWLYAKLSPGTYQVSATVAGKTIQRSVEVRNGAQNRTLFTWMHG